MSSLSFDQILLNKLAQSPLEPGPGSVLSRVADHLTLNDSDIWYKYPGLPFALNIEANLNGERHVIIHSLSLTLIILITSLAYLAYHVCFFNNIHYANFCLFRELSR